MPSVEIVDQLREGLLTAAALVAGAYLMAKWFDASRRLRRRALPVRAEATGGRVVRRGASGR
jgi:hypothetical protein